VIDRTRESLTQAGLSIEKELYKSSLDGQVAQGVYHLVSKNDPEIGMMFAWGNSYNKLHRFKCAVGARVFVCDNGMISGDMASYSRLHKGAGALHDAMTSIDYQISNAGSHFSQLIADKEMLKGIKMDRADQGAVLGQLFACEDIITLYQASVIKKQMDEPTYDYGTDPNTAWVMYNHITHALKESHPANYLKDHERVHQYFVDQFGQLKITNPNQGNDAPLPIDTLLNRITNGLMVGTEPSITGVGTGSSITGFSNLTTTNQNNEENTPPMFGVQFS
jgi:hypothetical protein